MNGRPLAAPLLLCPEGPSFSTERDPSAVGAQTLCYRQLAIRVINLALRDLTNPAGSTADRASARAFLEGSGMLLHWCAVAELDPARLAKHARSLGFARA